MVITKTGVLAQWTVCSETCPFRAGPGLGGLRSAWSLGCLGQGRHGCGFSALAPWRRAGRVASLLSQSGSGAAALFSWGDPGSPEAEPHSLYPQAQSPERQVPLGFQKGRNQTPLTVPEASLSPSLGAESPLWITPAGEPGEGVWERREVTSTCGWGEETASSSAGWARPSGRALFPERTLKPWPVAPREQPGPFSVLLLRFPSVTRPQATCTHLA